MKNKLAKIMARILTDEFINVAEYVTGLTILLTNLAMVVLIAFHVSSIVAIYALAILQAIAIWSILAMVAIKEFRR